jgi:hypothetical protein
VAEILQQDDALQVTLAVVFVVHSRQVE